MDIENIKNELSKVYPENNGYYILSGKELSVYRNCAQRVIDAAEVLPNKKEPTKQENDTLTYECYGEYNQAINECAAIVAKNYVRSDSLLTEEEILNVIATTKTCQSPFRNIAHQIYLAMEEKNEKLQNKIEL